MASVGTGFASSPSWRGRDKKYCDRDVIRIELRIIARRGLSLLHGP